MTVDADWAGDPKTRCSTSGGVLAIGPCFTVPHWSVTQGTVSLSSAESEAKAITKGCIEALCVKHLLEHQTARPFKIVVLDRHQQRRGHHATTWTRAQSGTLGGSDDVGSTVEQDGLISLNKLGTLENVADLLTKHVPRAVLDKLAGTVGYTFPDEETQRFQEYTSINQNDVRRWRERIVGG